MQVATLAWLQDVIIDMAKTGNTLTALKVGLFTNNPTLTRDSVYGDLTQPTYTGYAELTVTLGPTYQDSNGDWVQELGVFVFQPSGSTGLPVIIQGYYVYDSRAAGHVLLFAEYLPNGPKTLASTLDALKFEAEISIPNQQVWGGAIQIN